MGFLALATVVTALSTTPVHAESKQYWTESAEGVVSTSTDLLPYGNFRTMQLWSLSIQSSSQYGITKKLYGCRCGLVYRGRGYCVEE